MKTLVTALTIAAFSTFSYSQNDANLPAEDNWIGYMNVFELPSNGGAYQWGSPWGVDALKTTVDSAGGMLTLQPNFNTYNDNPTDPYWVDQSTGEGAKYMQALSFVEPGPSYNDADLNFHGEVMSYTLDTSQYSVFVFIKALDSTNGWADALQGSKIMPLPMSGTFSVSATAAELPSGLVIQYGFIVEGRNGNPAEEAQLGSVVLGKEYATNEVDFAASDMWIAFMNVFDLPANGGAYQFGSAWGLDDVKSTLTDDAVSNTLELQPNFNTYAENPTDPYWVDQTTMEGNKMMEASTFVEPGTGFNNAHLVFKGDIYEYTLDAAYEVEVFIKALDPANGYADALGGTSTMTLPTSGTFEVSASGADLKDGLIIQYGFTVRGVNANPLDEDALGSVIIGTSSLSTFDLAKNELNVYPNPAKDEVNIVSESTNVQVEIYGLSGQKIMSTTDKKIQIGHLPAGIYLLHVNDGEDIRVTKLYKQ